MKLKFKNISGSAFNKGNRTIPLLNRDDIGTKPRLYAMKRR